MSIAEWKNNTVAELKTSLSDLLRKQFKLRLTQSSGELAKHHQIKQVRRDIARILTLLTEKQKGSQ